MPEAGVCVIRPQGKAMKASCGEWSLRLLLNHGFGNGKTVLKNVALKLLGNSPGKMAVVTS